MQELRFVLIIVGALAIAALLFHGLWTSKKEGKVKFRDKPLGKLDSDRSFDEAGTTPNRSFAAKDDFERTRKEHQEPDFAVSPSATDPLIDSDPLIVGGDPRIDCDPLIDNGPLTAPQTKEVIEDDIELNDLPSFSVKDDPIQVQSEPDEIEQVAQSKLPNFELSDEQKQNHAGFKQQYGSFDNGDALKQPVEDSLITKESLASTDAATSPIAETIEPQSNQAEEPSLEVIVLNVHCAGDIPFVGTELFRSMENNGLIYGEMSIYHCFAQASDGPKAIFSVANMMQPGTLEHNDPADFITKGISFFMTLPCYGQADHNFNVMLSAAQKIADDMGGYVLDESRNLMTPSCLSDYRKQIRDFMTAANA